MCLNFRLSLTLKEPLKMEEDFTVESGRRIPEAAHLHGVGNQIGDPSRICDGFRKNHE